MFQNSTPGTPLRERLVKVNVGGKAKVGGKVKIGGECLLGWHLPPTVYFHVRVRNTPYLNG